MLITIKLPLKAIIASIILSSILLSTGAEAADYPFPVIGQSTFQDDFNAPRASGKHNAIDIIADKRQKIVSRTDGVLTYVANPQPSWGYMVQIRADNGNLYSYIHMNNDNLGTDDGKGGPFNAFGPDIERGNRVVKGQLLGYVGDSGNAEETVSHLHFEVERSNGTHVNPYSGLVNNSYRISNPNYNYPTIRNELIPSSPSFMGGYTVTSGNIDADGDDELIVGPGTGGRWIKTFDKNYSEVSRFTPNGTDFLGGVDVAAGDVDGDGVDEIVTGAGPGGRYLKIFEANGNLIGKFTPNGTDFLGGVDVAAGDVDGDGVDEIVTGARKGGRMVKVFKLDGTLISSFAPYGSTIGVSVAIGNFDNDPAVEIVTGAPKNGGPRVNVHDSDGKLLSTYYAYNQSFTGGLRVETGEFNSSNPYDEIITLSQEKGLPHAKITSRTGKTLGWTKYFAENYWQGHYDLTVSNNSDIYTSMGVNRRSTIRPTDLDL